MADIVPCHDVRMSEDVDLPPGYPVQWEADVVLRDGSVGHLRPIRPSDEEGLHAFHARQSDESIYLRFFAPLRRLSDKDVHRFSHVDYEDRVALVITVRDEILGIGRYDRIDASSAEVAFNVSDHYQGRGIGSVLLEHLAAIAQEFGITRFTAEVLPQNRKMLTVFSEAGYEVSRKVEDGVVALRFDIEPTDRSKAVVMSREHRAEAISVSRMLRPRTVAVIGAGRSPDSMGHHFLKNLLDGGFTGEVHPVNRKAKKILGRKAYDTIGDVPGPVDLAVIAVPAENVLQVVDECAAADVDALLVVSAGFGEGGGDGDDLQAELVRRARGSGMRIVGPNSFGLINTDPALSLNASLSPTMPPVGHLGLFAQSGALGIAVLASAARRNLGISTFGSAGNRVDVSGNDFMQYWIDDDDTHTVGLYLESMGNPRKFSRIARNLGRIKPVIVVQSGVSAYGIPPGHRVRRTKMRPAVFTAMLKQAGVIRVSNVHQMFDVAQLVVHQPLPTGRRVAIVGNSSALGALSAGAVAGRGLTVTHGPVNLPSEATAEEFLEALTKAFQDPDVDSVLTCFIPPIVAHDEEVTDAVRSAARASDKTCVATFLGMRGVDSSTYMDEGGTGQAIPIYAMPEDAAYALAKATKYAEWRNKDHGVLVSPAGINRRVAEDVVQTVLSVTPEGRRLDADETAALLTAYGIELWPTRRASTVEEAVEAAEDIGYPVVLKSTAPMLRHQGGITGVRVDLGGEQSVREAFASLNERLSPLAAGQLEVQRMATPGVSCVVTADEDPLFGPVVSFGVAGLPTELLDDISHRIPPLTDVAVSELISSVKAAPVLHGHRGSTPVHRAALADLIARVSTMSDDMPEIASLRLNPVNAHPGGVEVLGAEVTVAPTARRADPGRRSLT
jgi:acyl-CoA synthetase (NDP forming)/GNAT superfamily N-acetyltransferase